MKKPLILILLLITHFITNIIQAQPVAYPYPVKTLSLNIENKELAMAYMDIRPEQSNRKTVMLFHGKNFNGYYWKDVIDFLKEDGYRVIVPDQVGWGKSSRADIHYSFHLLASNSRALLDSLNTGQVIVIGHSMGGMLAARFALMYPERVEKLVLENPIGLEDYRTFVPYLTIDELYKNELKATYDSYKTYQMNYYPEWKAEYEQYIQAQAGDLNNGNFQQIARVNALTYDMIYQQPVCYEFSGIQAPTLLIIGQADRTIAGKALLSQGMQERHGQYPELGRKTRLLIPNSQLVEMQGVGHIPHIQDLPAFRQAVENFLK
jgi:pimeloyl-ACP methyl ester carboxylesterase